MNLLFGANLVTCRDNAHISFFCDDLKPRKVGQVFLVSDHGSSLVGLCMQDYKSLCAAVTIC